MSELKVDSIKNLAGDSRFGPVLGTPVAAAGQTFIDFTVPSWAKKVTVSIRGLSTSGSSPVMIQIGPSAGPETSGYGGGAYNPAAWAANTNGFLTAAQNSAANLLSGNAHLALCDPATNAWVFSFSGAGVGINTHGTGGGEKAIAGVLNKVRVTTSNGTDTFDAGSVNVMWE